MGPSDWLGTGPVCPVGDDAAKLPGNCIHPGTMTALGGSPVPTPEPTYWCGGRMDRRHGLAVRLRPGHSQPQRLPGDYRAHPHYGDPLTKRVWTTTDPIRNRWRMR